MKLQTIPINKILANFTQPREQFDKEKIKELAESILGNGLINPISVRTYKGGRFMIVAGERRWRSHKVAGLKTIQAFVKEYKSDVDWMRESWVENIHREDLNPLEKAKSFQKLEQEYFKDHPSATVADSCKEFSVAERTRASWLALLKQPTLVREAVKKEKIGIGSAQEMYQLPEKKQIEIAEDAMRRETGIGKSEIKGKVEEHKIKEEYGIKSLELEETEQDIINEALDGLSKFQGAMEKMKKKGFDMFKKSSLERIATSITVKFSYLLDLVKFGIKPDKRFIDLVKELKDGKKLS